MVSGLSRLARLLSLTMALLAIAGPAAAQPTKISDALSFLLTNRSVVTDDFARDQQAALSTRDTIIRFLQTELATLPVSSPAGGFTYRLNPALGTDERTSESFGPFFIQRSLTGGEGQLAFAVNFRRAAFDQIDGRSLTTGTLVATASQLRGDAQPFDVETLSMHLETDTLTAAATYGVTDRLDVSAAVPIVSVKLQGARVDTYRGQSVLQATADASAMGIGDLLFLVKYNVFRSGGSGVAIGGAATLPTGDEQNLLGAGQVSILPRVIGSLERDRVAIHGEAGVVLTGPSHYVDYGGAVTFVPGSRCTIAVEVIGQRFASGGQLTDVVSPNPQLVGVDTIRLVGTEQATTRLLMAAGVRWNVSGRWLVSVNGMRSITSVGLTATWIPTVTFDYSFGR
jgi:hypothetical protein